MPQISYIGSLAIGTCVCHDTPITVIGTISKGASTVAGEGPPLSRVGDMVVFSCGHVGFVIAGASTVIAEGPQLTRVGDIVASSCINIATVITGAGTSDSA